MKKEVIFFLVFLFILSACTTISEGGRFGGFFSGRSEAVGGKGIMLKFIDAPDEGYEMTERDVFNLGIEIENHVPGQRGLSGEVCVRDTLTSTYSGIPENECLSVELPPATDIEGRITPSIDLFKFGPYQYQNLEVSYSQPATIFADFKYELESLSFSSVCLKRQGAESQNIPSNCGKKQDLKVQQTDLPVKISRLTTRTSSSETSSILSMEILLSKTKSGQLVSSGDILGQQASAGYALVDFEVLVNRQPVQCSLAANNRIEFRQNENEKLIKCTVTLPLEGEHFDAPIRIKMGYGFIQTIRGPTVSLRKEDLSLS